MIRRRSFFTAMAAAAIPVLPGIVHAAPASRVLGLIEDINRASKSLDSIELQHRLADWETLADAQSILIDALIEEVPVTAAELSAKLDTLMSFHGHDEEGMLIDIAAEDARALAEMSRPIRRVAVVHVPVDAPGDRRGRVTASLEAAGHGRPAPMPSTPSQARPVMPIPICPAEA